MHARIVLVLLLVGCSHDPVQDTYVLTADQCLKLKIEVQNQTEQRDKAPIINAIKGN